MSAATVVVVIEAVIAVAPIAAAVVTARLVWPARAATDW